MPQKVSPTKTSNVMPRHRSLCVRTGHHSRLGLLGAVWLEADNYRGFTAIAKRVDLLIWLIAPYNWNLARGKNMSCR